MKFTASLQRKTKLASIILTGFLLSFVGLVHASQLSIDSPTTIYQSCVQPYIIKMDTNGIATKSVDAKLLLTGYFSFNTPFSLISEAIITETGYAQYIKGSNFIVTTLQTGIANSGVYQNREYLYINAHQFLGTDPTITGNDIPLATLYLKAENFTNGSLNFYTITGWNGDDSNISSGINEGAVSGSYTQYVDSLTGTIDVAQSFSGATNACTSRPYISSAYYRQTGYISTSTGVQAVWTSVVAGPLYSGTSNRTVWTKDTVQLVLTGVSDADLGAGGLNANNLSTGIQLNYVHAYDSPYITRLTTTTGWFTQYYESLISGNVRTGFVGFDNIIGNTGSTYLSGGQRYTDTFNIDVFWIDRVSPVHAGFTGYIAGTGEGYTQYTLSGSNFVGAGLHANWTDMDDEYKVLSFSGNNTITQDCEDRYVCSETGYMGYLNSTGYVRSGNNVFKLLHNIFFTTSFSGYITVIDRAGNTGEWYVEINMDDLIVVNYGLIAYPQSGIVRNELIDLSGMLLKLAIYSGGFDKTQLLSGLIYTGWIKTSTTGWAAFTGNFASGQYRVLAEGSNTLSYLLSGIQLSPIGGTIDYTQVYTGGFLFGDTYDIITTLGSKHASYLSNGANRDSTINVADLANLVTIWGEFSTIDTNPNIGIYSGTYFVDIPENGTGDKIIPYALLQSTEYSSKFMQYHPYDLNANGLLDVDDYSIANGNYNILGATVGGKLDGINPATMPF